MDRATQHYEYLAAIGWAQAGMGHEQAGNAAMAVSLYHQAAQELTKAVRQFDGATPAHVFYWLGVCEVRLAQWSWTHRQTATAHGWLSLAVPHLQAALEREPANPFYLYAVEEARLAVGPLPAAVPTAIPTATLASEPAPVEKPLPEQLKSWLGVGKQAVELWQGLSNLFGNGQSGGESSRASGGQFNPDDYAPPSMDWGTLTGGG